MTIEEHLKQFREKYEGANTGGAISSRQMDAMIQDIRSTITSIQREMVEKVENVEIRELSYSSPNDAHMLGQREMKQKIIDSLQSPVKEEAVIKCDEHLIFNICDHENYSCNYCCKCGAPTVFNGRVVSSTDNKTV